jgi:N6-adenosine-specific RNA methylase IME4
MSSDPDAVLLAEVDSQLEQVARYNQWLAEATTVDAIQHIRDFAEQARLYAKQKRLGLDAINRAAAFKLRADWKLGALYLAMPKHEGGRPVNRLQPATGFDPPTYAELGIEKTDAHRCQVIASLPPDEFNAFLEATATAGEELTTASAVRWAKARWQPVEPEEVDSSPALPKIICRCIVIDPPWPMQKIERDERPAQAAHLDYPTMSLDEIAALPVAERADATGCHLYLWVTQKFLPVGLALVEGWGFRYQCLMTWVKPTGMTPFSWMYNTEHVIFARLGDLDLLKNGEKLSFEAPSVRHSTKPDIFYERVLRVSPGPRLDMFARRERDGFTAWGNEVAHGAAEAHSA